MLKIDEELKAAIAQKVDQCDLCSTEEVCGTHYEYIKNTQKEFSDIDVTDYLLDSQKQSFSKQNRQTGKNN